MTQVRLQSTHGLVSTTALDVVGDEGPGRRRSWPVAAAVRLAQARRASVLVAGGSCANRERIARAIHDGSCRRDGPFVVVDCAALPRDVEESLENRTEALAQLLGYGQGAIAGRPGDGCGALQEARGGTLFLAEVEWIPLALQSHLARILRAGRVRRVGERSSTRLDVRVIASTNLDGDWLLAASIHDDLLECVAGIRIDVP